MHEGIVDSTKAVLLFVPLATILVSLLCVVVLWVRRTYNDASRAQTWSLAAVVGVGHVLAGSYLGVHFGGFRPGYPGYVAGMPAIALGLFWVIAAVLFILSLRYGTYGD